MFVYFISFHLCLCAVFSLFFALSSFWSFNFRYSLSLCFHFEWCENTNFCDHNKSKKKFCGVKKSCMRRVWWPMCCVSMNERVLARLWVDISFRSFLNFYFYFIVNWNSHFICWNSKFMSSIVHRICYNAHPEKKLIEFDESLGNWIESERVRANEEGQMRVSTYVDWCVYSNEKWTFSINRECVLVLVWIMCRLCV